MNHGKKAVAGFGWMFTSSASVQAIRILSNMVLARLLLPADFGAVALVLAVVAILQTFAELGMATALVKKAKITRSSIDSAFSATVILTLFIVVVLWLTSSLLAHFFKMPILSGLFKIAALSYLFTGMFSLFRGLLLRALRYKAISAIEFGASFIGGVMSIILAYRGYGAYSIVWGQLLLAIVSLLAGIHLTKYRPGSFGNLREMRKLFSFGMWVSLGRLMGHSAGKVDAFVIGKVLTAQALGGYYAAQKIVLLIPNTYARAIDQVMFPIYSRLSEDRARVQDGFFRTLSLTSIMLLPASVLVFLGADPLVRIFLGGQWLHVIPMVRIMSLYGIMRSLGGGVFSAVIYALGRPQLATVFNFFRMVALPICVLVGVKWGVLGVAWGFGLYGILGRIFSQWLLKHFFGFSLLRFLKATFPAALSALIATIPSALICHHFAHGSMLRIVVWNLAAISIWGGIYLSLIRLLAKKELEYILSMFKPAVKKTSVCCRLLPAERNS